MYSCAYVWNAKKPPLRAAFLYYIDCIRLGCGGTQSPIPTISDAFYLDE
ncbi:hypothetical protein SXCC_01417 [Gluconacetobacter sp. SXCC-1]|nr:hypothetical protein SXCC_01417 [Gluconacetobacter sp. SXCC-1]